MGSGVTSVYPEPVEAVDSVTWSQSSNSVIQGFAPFSLWPTAGRILVAVKGRGMHWSEGSTSFSAGTGRKSIGWAWDKVRCGPGTSGPTLHRGFRGWWKMPLPMQCWVYTASVEPGWMWGLGKGNTARGPLRRRQGGATLPGESRASWPPAQALPASSQLLGWSQQGWVDEPKGPERGRGRPTGTVMPEERPEHRSSSQGLGGGRRTEPTQAALFSHSFLHEEI